jgi:hypothetical protein
VSVGPQSTAWEEDDLCMLATQRADCEYLAAAYFCRLAWDGPEGSPGIKSQVFLGLLFEPSPVTRVNLGSVSREGVIIIRPINSGELWRRLVLRETRQETG